MGHHAGQPFNDFDNEESKKLFEELRLKGLSDQLKNPLDLGPTGKYPDGKIADNDEGEIKIGITTMKERIVIDFGKPIHTVGFEADQALSIASVLVKRAMEIKKTQNT